MFRPPLGILVGFEPVPRVAFEEFLTSIFSSWTLMLLFPPRRGARSFQRNQRMTTGILIVRNIVMPMTIHNLVDPDMPYASRSGPGRAVRQDLVGNDTKQGAVVLCIEQVL